MTETSERITINPEQCGGRPCIRNMRIRVVDVLDLLAQGLTSDQILEEMPDLEYEDIIAALLQKPEVASAAVTDTTEPEVINEVHWMEHVDPVRWYLDLVDRSFVVP